MKRLAIVKFKLVFLLLVLCRSNPISAQALIDQFGYSSYLCSGTYYLYSDSSFIYERGCEERSSITLGTFRLKNDTVFLFPKRLSQVDFIVSLEYITIEGMNSFKTVYVSKQDSVVEANAKYPSMNIARKWKENEIETDSVRNHPNVKFDVEKIHYFRVGKDTLASCPLELERLTGQRKVFPLYPGTNEIKIRLALPYDILIKLINYEMKYEEMEAQVFSEKNRIIKVVNP